MERDIKDNFSVREKIYRAAVELFARKGYSGTTIRNIVQKAEVTQPMVYYYYGNKEQLFTSCIKELYNQLTMVYQKIDPELPFDILLKKMLVAGKEKFADFPEGLFLMARFEYSPDEFPRIIDIINVFSAPLDLLISAIQKAKNKGEIVDYVSPQLFSSALFGTLGFLATVHFMKGRFEIFKSMDINVSIDEIVKLFAYGVLKKRSNYGKNISL